MAEPQVWEPIPVDPQTVNAWLSAGQALLVDVREEEEFEEERIPGAILMPLSSFDPHQLPQVPGKRTVLHCLIGGRSAKAAARIREATGTEEVIHLDGGLLAWKEAGLDTEGANESLTSSCL